MLKHQILSGTCFVVAIVTLLVHRNSRADTRAGDKDACTVVVADAGVPDAGPWSLNYCYGCDSGPSAYELGFSPSHQCTDLVVKTIGEARSTVRLAAYNFESQPIINALVAAHGRGVDVRAVLDRRTNELNKHSGMGALLAAKIPVVLDGKHPIMHDKFIIVDGVTLETGSFNYSNQAERNAENCLVLHGSIASVYTQNWDEHWSHGRGDGGVP